jgi:hypothetical protein
MKLLLALSSLGLLQAANIPLDVKGTTQTQIVISYVATSPAYCSIVAVERNGGMNAGETTVHDLDPVLFTNADRDLLRTYVNGFRWPTIVSGLTRIVTIGGHDEIKQSAGGKWYSTALQAVTNYTITVTCNGGSDAGTKDVMTANVPLASYYPEMLIPTPGSPLGGMPQPTIDYSVPNYKVNDPITGVLIQAVTKGTDNFNDSVPNAASWNSTVIDVNGNAWTNSSNFITNQVTGTLASTSTANAPLFAAFAAGWPNEWYTDLTVVPYGNSTATGVVAEWCLSTDSGLTCANYTPLDVTYSSGAAKTYSTIPSATPTSMFSGWGGMKVAYGTYDLTNRQLTGVSSAGHFVTVLVSLPNYGLPLDRVHGSKFQLSSCTAGSGGVFTVDHTDSEGQITMLESATNTNCTYTDLAVGVRVVLKNSGTLNVSLTASEWGARTATSGSNGERWVCARSKVSDIQTDCDGNTHNPPISGYLCGLANQGVYLIQDDGRMCLQSSLYSLNTSPQYHLIPELSSQISPIDSRSFLLPAIGQTSIVGHVIKITHVANNYQALPIDPSHSGNDRFTYTDLTATTTPIGTQIASAGGEVARGLGTGLWPAMGFDAILDNGSGGATIQYRSTSAGQDSQCMLAWADASTNMLLSTQPMYGGYPFSYSPCHFSSQGAAGYSLVGAEAESSQMSPIFFNPSIFLGGPFISRVTKVKKNGTFVDWSLSISGATNASPVVVTSMASDVDQVNAANSSQGAPITCSGGAGNWAALNGLLYAHYISANTFSLYTDALGASPVDSTAFGSFSGQSVTCKVAPPVYSIAIASVANNGGNARFTANTAAYFGPFYPSLTLPMKDGDPVAVNSATSMSSSAQYYAKISTAPSGQFDLYTDQSLTTPVSFTTASGWSGYSATLAETCPDPGTITLPGPMYMDTGFGTTGAGNQKVRCLWLRLNGEFCSDFPKAGEITGYPCPGTGVHTSQSMMHPINVGDGVMSLRSSGNNHEIMYVLKVDRSAGENQIDILVVRNYGDDCRYGWRGCTNAQSSDLYADQHSAGWTAWAAAIIPAGLVNTNASPNTYAIPPVNGSHFDFVPGHTAGNVSQASAYAHGVPDSRINVPVATFASPGTATHSSIPFFSGSASFSLTSLQQSYPSLRWRGDQAPASEQVWHGDWMAMNGGFGNSQNNGDGVGLPSVLQNIRGTTYDAGNSTTIVYKIPVQNAVNEKIVPLLVTASPHGVFVDMSGPGSLITDANSGKRCTAFVAGECRPNSAPGDTFMAGRGWYTAYGQCISNTSTLGSPCAFGLWPGGGWAVQVRDKPVDTNNLGVRRLTLGFWEPMKHYSFSNWVATPDAKWGIFAPNPVQQRAAAAQWFAMKLPPWLENDSKVRTTFVPQPIQTSAKLGDSVRVAFGYGENGDPGNLYCTTRAQTCWTSSTATASNPFVFAGEAQHPMICSSGNCVISIPAIPGRVLYYQVETNGRLGSLQSVAVP